MDGDINSYLDLISHSHTAHQEYIDAPSAAGRDGAAVFLDTERNTVDRLAGSVGMAAQAAPMGGRDSVTLLSKPKEIADNCLVALVVLDSQVGGERT